MPELLEVAVKHWLGFLREDLVPKQFPRQMFKSRVRVKDSAAYLKNMKQNYNTPTDCFISHYTLEQQASGVLDSIFTEVDGEGVRDGVLKGAAVQKAYLAKGYKFRLFFSGSRGFHFHLPFPPVPLKFPKRTVGMFLADLPVQFMDSHVLANLAQMVRVPWTKNKKSGLYAIELPAEFPLLKLRLGKLFAAASQLDIDSSPIVVEPNDCIAERLFELDKIKPKASNGFFKGRGSLGESMPPCVVHFIEELRSTSHLGHHERLHVAASLITLGYSDLEIAEVFRLHAMDYIGKKTLNQLEHIRRGRLHPCGCRRLRKENLCPIDYMYDCPFFPVGLYGRQTE